MGKNENYDRFICLASKFTADEDWSHEIKRHLSRGRKAMRKLDSILKSKDISLPTNVCIVKAMAFPIVMYGCENWTIIQAECQRTESRVWLFVTPWTAACQASLSSTFPQSLLKFKSFESMMFSSHLILCTPFSFCLQSFPASGSFPKSQLFISGGQLALQFQLQSYRWIFRWFLLGLTGLISKSPGDSQVSSPAPQFKSISSSLWSNSHPYKTTG